jgi:hypothetical protein
VGCGSEGGAQVGFDEPVDELGRAATLWVWTSNRVVCGVMVNTSGVAEERAVARCRSVLTVTVADGGDQLAQSRFQTVGHQHDLAPSAAGT